METRSTESGDRCNATGLVKSEQPATVCIPTFFSDSSCSQESCARSGPKYDFDNTSVADSAMVSGNTRFTDRESLYNNTANNDSKKSQRGKSPTDKKQLSYISGLENFRDKLVESGISNAAASLITNSRRESTETNYKSSWGKWSSWCFSKQIDPFQCSLNYILDFLASLFKEGYQYRSINNYRSAISAYHPLIDGVSVGKRPKICALMHGVFNKNPPQPRYSFTWDVQVVLDYIKTNWPDSESLQMKQLTFKLVMLLALASASRACALHSLDTRFMATHQDHIKFTYAKLHKGWRRGQPPPSVSFYNFQEDESLCVASTIKVYDRRTKAWRGETGDKQLLISYVKPHRGVTSSTISRWIKKIIGLAGFNIEVFKGHSSRSASSISADLSGTSVADILKMGSWSNASTWQRFYNKPVVSPEMSYQSSIFRKNKSFEQRK